MAGSLRRREEDLIEAADTQRRLRTRLEAITESMNEALVAVDPDGIVITVNSTAADYFGRPADELVGADVTDLLDGLDGQGEPLFEALGGPADPRSVALRGRLFVSDGAAMDVAASAAPLIDDRGRVYVLRDITGEAQVERMKTEFISNISHELRTPLTPVKAYAALLASRPDMPRDKLQIVADQLQTSSGQLERIIDMLVTFAALEAGRVELASTRVDLRSLVDGVLGRWREQYPTRTFRRRLRKDTPAVDTDPRLLAQVLDELIDNARKFSEGPIDVHAERADGDRVRLTVKDRGSGIPEEDLAHVSRDFHQVDGSTTRHYGGLGLGLAIVERTLVLLDGRLEIESEVGQGTHVHVLLPVAD
jgi:PAS domain S-box-containing protein